MRWIRLVGARALVPFLIVALLSGGARPGAAASGLVIDGTEIADAAVVDGAKKEGKLLLYSTYESTAMKKLLAAFQADTGISADVIRLTSQPMFERATAEFSAHRLPADWVDTTDITLTDQLASKGILTSTSVPAGRALPKVLRDDGGRWYMTIRSLMVVGVNTAIVKPNEIPAKWTDLLDPRWKGKIGCASIDAGGTTYSVYFFLRQKYGLDFWKKLAAQDPRLVPSAAPVITDLARGETSLALEPQESLLGAIAEGAPVKIVYPAGGSPAYGISGGITSTAPHPHAAQLWLDWITSKRGGAVLAGIGAYGINPAAPGPTVPGLTMPPVSEVYNIRAADYNQSRDTYTKEWHQIFGRR
jgi:iron(III) transport system substrate-binding protein